MRTLVIALAVVAQALLAAPVFSQPAPQKGQVAAYKGKMVDEAGKPVSGIFPMTFRLYPGLKARKASWSETAWVAVDRGVYTVRLGERVPLPEGDLSKFLIGVDIRGVGEVVREPFSGQVAAAPAKTEAPAVTSGAASHSGSVKYADTAGFAVEADHAKTADRIGNLTVEDLIRKIIEEGGGGGGGEKVKIGSAKRYGNRIGGPGGTAEYNEVCPKGYVMTGIKGGAGIYLDSIQIVCSPIE